jgi:hypothetical protein
MTNPGAKLLLRSVSIKGQYYMEEGPAVTAPLQTGDRVHFQCDPDNPADPAAVRAFYGELDHLSIGYLQKEVSPVVALFLNGGYSVVGTVVDRSPKTGNVSVDVWADKP